MFMVPLEMDFDKFQNKRFEKHWLISVDIHYICIYTHKQAQHISACCISVQWENVCFKLLERSYPTRVARLAGKR